MDSDKPNPEKQHCQEEKRVQDVPEAFQHPESRQRWGRVQWMKKQGQGRNQERPASRKSREMCVRCVRRSREQRSENRLLDLVMRPSLVTSMGELDVILTCDKLNRRGE